MNILLPYLIEHYLEESSYNNHYNDIKRGKAAQDTSEWGQIIFSYRLKVSRVMQIIVKANGLSNPTSCVCVCVIYFLLYITYNLLSCYYLLLHVMVCHFSQVITAGCSQGSRGCRKKCSQSTNHLNWCYSRLSLFIMNYTNVDLQC